MNILFMDMESNLPPGVTDKQTECGCECGKCDFDPLNAPNEND